MKAKELFLRKMWAYLSPKDNTIVYVIKNKGVTVETIEKPVVENKAKRLKELNRFKGFLLLDTEQLFLDNAQAVKSGLGVKGFRDLLGFFKRTYISSSSGERQKMIVSINQLLEEMPYNFLIETLYPYFQTKLSPTDFLEVWKNMPNISYGLSSTPNRLNLFIKYIEELNIDDNLKEEILFIFISKNAGKIKSLEKLSVFTRDYLLDRYAHNKEVLNKYITYLPMIDISTEDDFSYMDNPLIKDILYVEINCEKLKAKIKIPRWKVINYKNVLDSVLDVLFLNYDEIRSTKLDKIKDENKEEKFSILITKKTKEGLSQSQLEELLKDLFLFISSSYESWPLQKNQKEEFLTVWLNKYKLDKLLSKKEDVSSVKVRKI